MDLLDYDSSDEDEPANKARITNDELKLVSGKKNKTQVGIPSPPPPPSFKRNGGGATAPKQLNFLPVAGDWPSIIYIDVPSAVIAQLHEHTVSAANILQIPLYSLLPPIPKEEEKTTTTSTSSSSTPFTTLPLHISLSKSFSLRHHQIQPLVEELTRSIIAATTTTSSSRASPTAFTNAHRDGEKESRKRQRENTTGATTLISPFPIILYQPCVLLNENKTRSFIGLLVGDLEKEEEEDTSASSTTTTTTTDDHSGKPELIHLIRSLIDPCLQSFGKPSYYSPALPHVSLATVEGDISDLARSVGMPVHTGGLQEEEEGIQNKDKEEQEEQGEGEQTGAGGGGRPRIANTRTNNVESHFLMTQKALHATITPREKGSSSSSSGGNDRRERGDKAEQSSSSSSSVVVVENSRIIRPTQVTSSSSAFDANLPEGTAAATTTATAAAAPAVMWDITQFHCKIGNQHFSFSL